MFFLFLFLAFFIVSTQQIIAQKTIPEIQFKLNESGNNFIKFNFSNQIWLRYTDLNPGSQLDGYDLKNNFDIGLRRTRFQFTGKLDRILLYLHVGQNNFTFNSARKQGIFIHDAVGEIELVKDKFYLGTGLTGWASYSRYSAPSTTSPLSLDIPLYQFSTLDASDQFIRKLAIYAKGLLGNFNYRIAIAKPMSINNSTQSTSISNRALFSAKPSKLQTQAYLVYHFWEKESNAAAYFVGTHLGSKKVLNIGIGLLHQKDAMWRSINSAQDTIEEDLKIYNIDAFLEYPFDTDKQNALTFYSSYSYTDFGKDYVRNIGVMNPANGSNSNAVFNGAGNAFPMIGTGHNALIQLGYLFRKDLLKDWGTMQAYFSMQYGKFDLLKTAAITYDMGIHWLIIGHKAKLSFNYQNRPIFEEKTSNNIVQTLRKGMFITQFQIAI